MMEAQKKWEATFEAWKAQHLTKYQMMERIQTVCFPHYAIINWVFDVLDEWEEKNES